MSFRQRLVPVMLATFVGIASGIYIFDPLLKQYALDSRGTYDPKIAQASTQGGVGGGLIPSAQGESATTKKEKQGGAVISGEEARQKLKEVIAASEKERTSIKK